MVMVRSIKNFLCLYQNKIDFLTSDFIVVEGRNQLKFNAQIQIAAT